MEALSLYMLGFITFKHDNRRTDCAIAYEPCPLHLDADYKIATKAWNFAS